MSIRRRLAQILLWLPPVRRYAQEKWQLREALQQAVAERDRAIVERNTLRDEVERLGEAAEYDRDAAFERVEKVQSELKELRVSATAREQITQASLARAIGESDRLRAELARLLNQQSSKAKNLKSTL